MRSTNWMRKLLHAGAAAAAVAAVVPAASATAAAPKGDAIWVESATARATDGALAYGSTFTAGYTSKTTQPWGLAECWAGPDTVLGDPGDGSYTPGDVIWSQYRSIYPSGPTPGVFQLLDPIRQLWLGGGATCRLSLVKFSADYSRRTVLATTSFLVTG